MMKFLTSILLCTIFIHAFTWEARCSDSKLLPALERTLLLRDPSKGLIKEKELVRLPLSISQKKTALRHLERFSERVPLDDSRIFWIDRFHRDLYRAILNKKNTHEVKDFRSVETSWQTTFGHQSGVFMRPDELPLPNNESSPYLSADLQIALQARELPRYGTIQFQLYGHRRDIERKQLGAYDTQTLGVALAFQKAVDELKLDLEQSFFGSSASRPGSLKAKASYKTEREVISAFLNGRLTQRVEIEHAAFTDQAKLDASGQKKDFTKFDFELSLELLPFQFFNGRTQVSLGGRTYRQSSNASTLDRLGFEPNIKLEWKEPSGTYEFHSQIGYLIHLSQKDALGDRDDQLLSWKGQLQRNMSNQWAIHGGWEFYDHTSKQTVYNLRNEVVFIGMDGRW